MSPRGLHTIQDACGEMPDRGRTIDREFDIVVFSSPPDTMQDYFTERLISLDLGKSNGCLAQRKWSMVVPIPKGTIFASVHPAIT